MSRNGVMRGGITAEDIVAQMIVEVLMAYEPSSSRDPWYPETGRDLTNYLKGVIDNVLAKIARDPNYIRTFSASELTPESEDEIDFMASLACVDDRPEFEENAAKGEGIIEGFIASLAGESKLLEVVNCYLVGKDKPAQIAEFLRISVREVNNRQKRLRRHADDYLNNQEVVDLPPEILAGRSQSPGTPAGIPRLIATIRRTRRRRI